MPKPVAFMVMPFGRKATGRTEKKVPAEIDFDALWDRVYQPVLEDGLGYRAVRADRDVGALIITQMIQRLAIADLVVADITLPNANVYYEVGVRHAAMRQGCVLVSADWALPVFDLAQMRQLRFPLPDGAVKRKKAVSAALDVLGRDLKALVDGVSPVFDAVPGFPTPDATKVTAFEDTVAELAQFDADTRAIRATPQSRRPARVKRLLEQYGSHEIVRDVVALELLRLVRDHLGWPAVLEYIDTLPEHLARAPLVLEQQALALSGTGDVEGAIGRLEQLIDAHGETSERLGLLGGRYRRLAGAAESAADRRWYLGKAIDAYQRGMDVDLNDYYPTSNLARLYRQRNDPGDELRAADAEVVTAVACRAAIANGSADEWARATLLANAFDRGDVAEAIRLRADVEAEGLAAWQLDSIIDSLRHSVDGHADPQVQDGLKAVLEGLQALM
jgi:hypothetical protein